MKSSGKNLLFVALITVVAAWPSLAQAQTAGADFSDDRSASVQGVVCDSHKLPVAGAVVHLEQKSSDSKKQTLTATTDSQGTYKFSRLHSATYTLRVEMAGYGVTASPEFDITANNSKEIDLTLQDAKANGSGTSVQSQPEFFDEPHFTVAGVTDTTNLGGHGSSTAGNRNQEELAKAIAALGDSPSDTSSSLPRDDAREKSLREEVQNNPQDFKANYQFGKWLLETGNAVEATHYLQQARRMKPTDFDAAYQLASAYFSKSEYERAQAQLLALIPSKEQTHQTADLHHLLGQIDEKLNEPLQAVREFQRAAESDASEQNLFDWGSELLLHRAAEPAAEVFDEGHRLYQNSVRMLTALGTAWYELGFYEKAAATVAEASDLDPLDVNPYLLMGKMQSVSAIQSETVAQKLERFTKIYPDNAWANYYYAVSLMKGQGASDGNKAKAETLLLISVQQDPKLGEAYVQLGTLYAEEKDFAKAISAYRQAIAEEANLEQAHYRLAQAYRRLGEDSEAQVELQIYEKISKQKAEEAEREHRQVQQFVYQVQEEKPTPPR